MEVSFSFKQLICDQRHFPRLKNIIMSNIQPTDRPYGVWVTNPEKECLFAVLTGCYKRRKLISWSSYLVVVVKAVILFLKVMLSCLLLLNNKSM